MLKYITNNKLLLLLKALDNKERKGFHLFLQGVYTARKKQLALYEHLLTVAPNFEESTLLEIGQVHQTVFERSLETEKDHKNLLNILSDLTKCLEDFLILKAMEKKSFQRTYLLQAIYREKGLAEKYLHPLEAAQQALSKKPKSEWSSQDFLKQIQINDLLYFQFKLDKHQQEAIYLEEGMNAIDAYFIYQKLKFACELISRKNILSLDAHNTSFLLTIKELSLKNKSLTEYPKIHLYWLFYKMISESNKEAFEAVKKYILNDNKQADSIKRDALTYAINYISKQIGKGQINYAKDALELYKYSICKNFFLYKIGSELLIKKTYYMNAVIVACLEGDIEWAKYFIDNYRNYLKTAIRRDLYRLAKARIYFGQKRYGRVVKFLSKLQFKSPSFKIQAISLRIIGLFEEAAFEECIEQCNSLKTLLEKFKIKANNYTNFIQLMIDLATEKMSKNDIPISHKIPEKILYKYWFQENILSN